jgi:hypothetical protein
MMFLCGGLSSARAWYALQLACLLVLCQTQIVAADGKFVAPLTVAESPNIVTQRAAVIFRDGVETLIVQSDVDGVGSDVAWLLPLPAEPTSIEACSPNTLKALNTLVNVKVISPQAWPVATSALSAISLILLCLAHRRHRVSGVKGRLAPEEKLLASIALGSVFVAMVLLPALGTVGYGGRSAGNGIELLQMKRAGLYETVVLKGETAEALEKWLSDNGFKAPASATEVIDSYIDQDWCFLAAKVSSKADSLLSHHPLKVVFPVDEAVYPMRLTGVDAEPMDLELYVISDREASVPGMSTWVCDVYHELKNDEKQHRAGYWTDEYLEQYQSSMPPMFAGQHSRRTLGIPELSTSMWDGCVLSRLHGRMSAQDMNKDIRFGWKEPNLGKARLYTHRSALISSACWGILAMGVAFIPMTVIAVKRRWSLQAILRKSLPVVLVVAVTCCGARYLLAEVVPARQSNFFNWEARDKIGFHVTVLSNAAQEYPDLPFPEAYQKLLQDLADRDDKGVPEVVDPLAEPGDVKIEATDDGWDVTILSDWYIPLTVRVSSNGRPVLN